MNIALHFKINNNSSRFGGRTNDQKQVISHIFFLSFERTLHTIMTIINKWPLTQIPAASRLPAQGVSLFISARQKFGALLRSPFLLLSFSSSPSSFSSSSASSSSSFSLSLFIFFYPLTAPQLVRASSDHITSLYGFKLQENDNNCAR